MSIRLLLCLLLAALMAACGRSGDGPGAAASAPGAAGQQQAAQLMRLERQWRGRPDEAQQVLAALTQQLAPGSPELLEAQALRGLIAAAQRDRGLVDLMAQQLRQWPNPALAASARLAAVSVQGEYPRQQGDLRDARKLLQAVTADDLAAAGPIYRWRYVRQLNAVASEGGEFEKALEHAHSELKLAEELGHSWRVALALIDLAEVSRRADTLARAKQLSSQAVAEALKDPDPVTLNAVHVARGVIYAEDSDTSVTLQSYSDALEQATLAGSDRLKALVLGNFADYHLRLGHWARALELAQQALPLALASRNQSAEVVARANIGLAKISMGRVAEGRNDVIVGIRLDEQQGAWPSAADGWMELAGYLERASDLKGAVAAQQEFRRVADRVLRDDIRKVLLETQERYDAEQRQRDIELLNRDNALKSEQLSERNLELGLWAALVGCVLVSVALVVQALHKVRRTNQALAISNATLKRQSESDPLTGLANRRHFQAAIKTLARPDGLEGSVFLVDVDHFKRINDAYGHAVGDKVLVEIARRLRAAVRDDDLVVRWGGEEFLIVASTSEPEFARGLAQRLLDLIGTEPVVYEGGSVPVSASIGFVSLPLAPHAVRLRWERAIDLVDTVMYLAKARGRNKAYGVERIEAHDELAAVQLTKHLEAAWARGDVALLSLLGPPRPAMLETGFHQAYTGGAA